MDGGGAGVVWQIGPSHFVLLFVNFPKMLKSTKTDHFLKRYHVIIRHASNCEFALFETIFGKKSKIKTKKGKPRATRPLPRPADLRPTPMGSILTAEQQILTAEQLIFTRDR